MSTVHLGARHYRINIDPPNSMRLLDDKWRPLVMLRLTRRLVGVVNEYLKEALLLSERLGRSEQRHARLPNLDGWQSSPLILSV